jgi:hypothetical protein
MVDYGANNHEYDHKQNQDYESTKVGFSRSTPPEHNHKKGVEADELTISS